MQREARRAVSSSHWVFYVPILAGLQKLSFSPSPHAEHVHEVVVPILTAFLRFPELFQSTARGERSCYLCCTRRTCWSQSPGRMHSKSRSWTRVPGLSTPCCSPPRPLVWLHHYCGIDITCSVLSRGTQARTIRSLSYCLFSHCY